MEIPATLLKFKTHIILTLSLSLLAVSLYYISPRFIHIIAFFWPLFLSTALFLVAIVVFGHASPLANEPHGEKAAEGILGFVAGQTEELLAPVMEASTSETL